MHIGYARVSTDEQSLDLQIDALVKAGVDADHIYRDKASGSRRDRPQLKAVLERLQPGDTLVIWKMDRLSRSLLDLLNLLRELGARGVAFHSLTEKIDTSTAIGRCIMHVIAAFAEFEKEQLKERVNAGLRAARKAGRIGGRRFKFSAEQQQHIIELIDAGKTAGEVARLFKVHPATIGRLLHRRQLVQEQIA
jgi:DNA invertase Pin-like site-specific DNA recombinase